MQDIVLSANEPAAAMTELEKCKNKYDVSIKTRNIEFGTDYGIGDIIRFQKGSKTYYKQITSVEMWLEGSTYHEEPTLTEWEE